MHVKKRRRSGLRRGFLACIIGEIAKSRCVSYFSTVPKLVLPNTEISFVDIAWSKHPTFEGVELKHIVISEQTGGQFSYHLVKIALNKKTKYMFARRN